MSRTIPEVVMLADAPIIERLRDHVHKKGWGYAGPYRCGIAAGELGLIDVEPWWPTEHSRQIFRDGIAVGQERAEKASMLKAPPHAAITIALSTAKYRARRPEERSEHIAYLLDRLLSGEEVSQSEFEHYKIKVTIREAVAPEILGET